MGNDKDKKYKEVTIDGIKVRYIETPGVLYGRYKVSVLIGNEHKVNTVVCPKDSLMDELEEMVYIQRMRRRNRK